MNPRIAFHLALQWFRALISQIVISKLLQPVNAPTVEIGTARMPHSNLPAVTAEQIEQKIHIVRGHRIMLDQDLSKLYGVSTKRLNEQVARNRERFPPDFAFRLAPQEFAVLRSQIATSKAGSGGRRYLPLAFTEQGVAMLSSVLRSATAVRVN